MDFLAARKALLARPERLRWRIVATGLAITALLTLLFFYQPGFLRFIEAKIYDTCLRAGRFAPPSASSQRPVIVDIDERSLARLGQWPWPRHRLAALMDTINAMQPASVAVDIVFPEPDRTSWVRVRESFARDHGISLPLTGVPDHLLDNDLILAAALSRGPFALAYGFAFSDENGNRPPCDRHPAARLTINSPASAEAYNQLFHASSAVCGIDPLHQAAAAGFINATPDQDGVLRRMPLVIAYQGQLYPNLALRAVMLARGTAQIQPDLGQGVLARIRLGTATVPVDAKGNLLIRFQPDFRPYDHVGADDLLDGLVPRDRIQGRVVLVGTTAMGLETHHTTPLGDLAPGIAVHATVAENLLNARFLAVPEWSGRMELALLIAAGSLSTLLLGATGSLPSLAILVVVGMGLWFGSGWLLPAHAVFISPLFPLMALALNFTLLTFLNYRQEERILRQRNQDLVSMQSFTIQCLAMLTETRDSETGRHIIRCQQYVKALAERLARTESHGRLLTEEIIDQLSKSAPLHDIGKIGVPDRVLLKPGRLTEEEYEEMKRHTTYGREAIERAEHAYGQGVKESFLQIGKEMAGTHHEWWSGGGYPMGLRGEEIPLSGRIMAIADVYDALICRRRYKPAFTHEQAVAIIAQGKGVHFDPELVATFLEIHETFRQIANDFPDEPSSEEENPEKAG